MNGETVKFDFPNGKPTAEQLNMVMNLIGIEVSYVDENKRLVYYNAVKDAVFTRKPTDIGRDLHECHPPHCHPAIDKIVAAFRDGSRDFAEFRINVKGKFIRICYYPVRDAEGNYRGVMETSQDISDIRKMWFKKEKLDW